MSEPIKVKAKCWFWDNNQIVCRDYCKSEKKCKDGIIEVELVGVIATQVDDRVKMLISCSECGRAIEVKGTGEAATKQRAEFIKDLLDITLTIKNAVDPLGYCEMKMNKLVSKYKDTK